MIRRAASPPPSSRDRLTVSFCRQPFVELSSGGHASMDGRGRSGHRLLAWLVVAERDGGGFEQLRGGRGRQETWEALGGRDEGLKGARRDLRRALEGLSPGLRERLFPIGQRGESDRLSLGEFELVIDVVELTATLDAARAANVARDHEGAVELVDGALGRFDGAWDGGQVRSWLQPHRDALERFRTSLLAVRFEAWVGVVETAATSPDPQMRAAGRQAAERLAAAGRIADVAESYLLLGETAEERQQRLRRLTSEDSLSRATRARIERLAADPTSLPVKAPAASAEGRGWKRWAAIAAGAAALVLAAGVAVALVASGGGGPEPATGASIGPQPPRPTRACRPAAFCTTTFPYITFNSLTNVPEYGDERDFLRARDWQDAGLTRDPIVHSGDDLDVLLRIGNNADPAHLGDAATAHDVRAAMRLPRVPAREQVVVASVDSPSARPTTVTDTLVVRGDQPFTLEPADREAWVWRFRDGRWARTDVDAAELLGAGVDLGDWEAAQIDQGYAQIRLEAVASASSGTPTSAHGYYPPRDAVDCDSGGDCPGTDTPSLNALRFTGEALPQGIPDERRFLNGVVESDQVRTLRDPLLVRPGDRIRIEAVVDNGARFGGTASDVRAWLAMPEEGGRVIDLLAAVSGSDVDPPVVSDSLTIESEEPVFLMYVLGSARWRTGSFGGRLPNGLVGSYSPTDLERRALGRRGVLVGCSERDGELGGSEDCAGVVSAVFDVRYAADDTYVNTVGPVTAIGGLGELKLRASPYALGGYAGPSYDHADFAFPRTGAYVDCKIDDGSTVWLHVDAENGGYFVPKSPQVRVRPFGPNGGIQACAG